MTRWKRGSSYVEDLNAPVRVYRRRPGPDAAANTGRDHRAAGDSSTDPPPPPSQRQFPFGAPTSGDPSGRGAPTPPPRGPAPPSPTPHPPPHGALGSTAYPSPPPPPPPQQRGSTAADLTPRHRGVGRPKHEPPCSPAAPSSAPLRTATPPTPSSEPARGSAPSPPSSAPARGGTPPHPSSAPARRGTPPHSSSAPARRGTPPLPSSVPNRGATPPSSGNASPSLDVRTPSPSYVGSSSSSGAGAFTSGSGGSTASSSSTKSFASLFHPQKQIDDNMLRSKLFDFLNEFTVDSAKSPYYKAQVSALRVEGNFRLGIHFEHLLKHDKTMAIAICNKQERVHEFVHPVICKFLFDQKLADNRNEIAQKLQVEFFSMPRSIKYVSEFIRENGGNLAMLVTIAGSISECVARDVGIMVVQRSAAEVFRAHEQGLTWNGEFDITDMVAVNDDEIRIIKTPVPGEPAEQARDVHKIGSTFMPMFILNGKMALYFTVLAQDLKNARESEVKEGWFREYILGHPGLRPSPVRYNLLDGVHQTTKEYCIEGSNIKTFLDAIPPFSTDWRRLISTESSNVFFKVYWFRFQPTEGMLEPFKKTNGGILAFKRHFTRHANEYLKKIKDLCELEMIGARKFEEALPYTVKMLLKDCAMHKRGPLLLHWKPYRDFRACRDGRFNLQGIIGFYPSFW